MHAPYNDEEVYQRMRRAGINVLPNWPREKYIEAFLGTIPLEENPFDLTRDALIAFIDEYWQQLQAQLKCPAKNLHHSDPVKVDPKPCYKCLDMFVAACVADMPEQGRQRLYEIRNTIRSRR